MENQYTFIFDGTPKEFLRRLENRGKTELLHFLDHFSQARPFVYNGLEYTIESLPTKYGSGNTINRLEYYAWGDPVGMRVEQIEKDIPPTKELGIRFELTPRLDERTNIIATCFHPAYEREFRTMMESLGLENDTQLRTFVQEDGLTQREKEVAGCLAQKMTKPQIAEKLIISHQTVKTHCRKISKKWELKTEGTQELQQEALRRGYGKG